MKLKLQSTFTALIMVFVVSFSATAQEMTVQDFMDEANDYISSKKYKEAVNALNGAINEVNKLLILQIKETMPESLGEFKAEVNDDESAGTAAMGFMGGGLSVERSYFKTPDNWDNYMKASIVGNSPMLASVNMMLSNSMYMAGSGAKVIKMGTRKAILTEESDGDYQLQMPLSSSLITIEGYGFQSSDQFYSKAKLFPFDEVAKSLGE